MFSRYILVDTIEQLESRFDLPQQSISVHPNYNISIGQLAPLLTGDNPKEIQFFKFGLTPFWAKQEMFLFNARAEGDHNRVDKPDFKGAKGIIVKEAFRKPIRSQRCLVIASAFIVGTMSNGLSEPFLVYLRGHKHPFAFAGIWDTWKNPETEEIINSFCIITVAANNLMQKVGNTRMPIILSRHAERKWLNPDAHLSEVTSLLNQYDSKLMNAYPIDTRIKNILENDKGLIQPVGDRIYPETDTQVIPKLDMSGHYHSKKKQGETGATMADKVDRMRNTENPATG